VALIPASVAFIEGSNWFEVVRAFLLVFLPSFLLVLLFLSAVARRARRLHPPNASV
jgi:hypothetical protein